jgi:hypothetical protein
MMSTNDARGRQTPDLVDEMVIRMVGRQGEERDYFLYHILVIFVCLIFFCS